jgi:N-hydroxyarylamine O-acetyltransferase
VTRAVDLPAYFERIGWGGGTRLTYDTLAALLAAHMAAMPFENLDVLLGRPIRLDLAGLQQKLVRDRRGGYCFEQATLFAAVLEALGFAPVRHTARVIMSTPACESPRTHMFLAIDLAEGRFVLDPGFGSLAPRVPVPLTPKEIVHSGSDTHRLDREGPHWVLRARIAGKDTDCWQTTLEQDHPVDFEMGNYFTSTYATSPFRRTLMMRAFTQEGRVTVLNRDLTIRRGDQAQTTQIADRRVLRGILREHFAIDLPEVETMPVPSVPEWST